MNIFSDSDIPVEFSNCTDGGLRLSSGSAVLKGRVEVCYSNTWYGVCADNYNSDYFASTICKELNFSLYGKDLLISFVVTFCLRCSWFFGYIY